MAAIRTATPADLAPVAAFLAARLGGEGGAARYRRYLEYRWLPSKPDLGIVLEDAGQIRGFIGAIYADRRCGGELRRFCNLTSIAVDESHRKHTLQMFNMLFKHKDITFTCFSASEGIAKILDFFKFEHCASEKVMFAPPAGVSRLKRGVRVLTDPAQLDAELDDDQRAVARDHRAYHCGQALIIDGDRRCFVVTARRGRDVRMFADVLHASAPDVLVEHIARLHVPLFRAHRTILTGIDRRWVRDPSRLSFRYAKLRPIYARSPVLKLAQVDALYTELVAGST
jgi:hypothetical protein